MSRLKAISVFFIHFPLQMLNLACWALLITLIGLLKLIIPSTRMTRRLNALNAQLEIRFGVISTRLVTFFNRIDVSHTIQGSLSEDKWYLIMANHRSYLDIILLIGFADKRIPAPKFFLKKELIWLPFVGLGAWALDMPFMRRYSRADIARRPELQGKDIATTRQACAKYQSVPTSIINFVEGTRFTSDKHHSKQSPYTHLLPPKAAGLAFTLAAMGELFTHILDVTIIYPDNTKWPMMDMLCGNMKRIIIDVNVLPVSAELMGDYHGSLAFKQGFQAWLNQIWHDKDKRISQLVSD